MPDEGPYSLYEARLFAKKYANAKGEKQLGQSFWRDFFIGICRVGDLLAKGIEFEYLVKSATTQEPNFIDVLWPNVVLIEHKSAGLSLDVAETQARDYLNSLDGALRPTVILVSDFKRLRIIEVIANRTIEFPLTELPENIHRIESILGQYTKRVAHKETTADVRAASLMSNLFVEFENENFQGHEVSVFLVRILFLLFGDDTRMWRRREYGLFQEIVKASPISGKGLGAAIQEVFQVLNTPIQKRPKNLDKSLVDFPYVNGGLFSEVLQIFTFTPKMRSALIDAGMYNWSKISPAIFGAMFQTIKSKEARRALGEHYTSEADILKVIGPLFLNEINEKLQAAWYNASALKHLRTELGTYNFLDPACGSGNFLLIAYKRMREIELRIIARLMELEPEEGPGASETRFKIQIHLSQFHGIEYEEWSSQIATVAMYLADHQANLVMEELTGAASNRFPLTESATILHGNALNSDWGKVCPMNENTIIMGNPPFAGTLNAEQKADTSRTWNNISGSGVVDYVANWFLVAARHIAESDARAAFLATNSITQGEQPPVIWGQLYPLGIGIDFAHRTFAWNNGAAGKAGVHIVIIGFSKRQKHAKRALWAYATPRSEPVLTWAQNINAYLIDAPNILVTARTTPLSRGMPPMNYGSKPTDGGHLSNISSAETAEIRKKDPVAAKYLRRLIGAQELIHNEERYCLWLVDADPRDLHNSPELARRVAAVREFRVNSPKKTTQKDADKPGLFQQIRQPKKNYLAVSLHSSEDRDYVPIARFNQDIIANNSVSIIEDDSLETYGVMNSKVFNIWAKAVSGRLESRVRISNTITYNNFPYPTVTKAQVRKIEDGMVGVMNARESFPHNDLAELYDKNSMPDQLRKAHTVLDKAVLAVYGLAPDASDQEIAAKMFKVYAEMTHQTSPAGPAANIGEAA
jgi:hypothetical protein